MQSNASQFTWSTLRAAMLSCVLLVCAACSTRQPIPTGVIPSPPAASVADEEYGQNVLVALTRQFPLDQDDARRNRVDDIMRNLTSAPELSREVWKSYVLVGDNTVNAAATRGNYIFVWTGMLNFVIDDDELAAVLAHEVAHVLAGHTYPTPEEEAQRVLSQIGGRVSQEVVLGTSSSPAAGLYAGLAGLATQLIINSVFINPESQRQELEADEIGLFLMASAGYDPEAALRLWTRMSEKGGSVPGVLNFLSTHPSSRARLTRIRELLPLVRRGEAPSPLYSAPHHHAAPHRTPSAPPTVNDDVSQGRRLQQHQPPSTIASFGVEDANFSSAQKFVITAERAAIYKYPGGRDAEPLLVLGAGDHVTVSFSEGPWYGIIEPVSGWIRADVLMHAGSR